MAAGGGELIGAIFRLRRVDRRVVTLGVSAVSSSHGLLLGRDFVSELRFLLESFVVSMLFSSSRSCIMPLSKSSLATGGDDDSKETLLRSTSCSSSHWSTGGSEGSWSSSWLSMASVSASVEASTSISSESSFASVIGSSVSISVSVSISISISVS